MTQAKVWWLVAGALVLGAAGGYGAARLGGRDGARARDDSPAVATFEGGRVTAGALEARIAEEGPLARERYASREARLELARQMVREQLLAREARQRGLDRDPGVVRQCEGALTELLLEREVEGPERQQPVSEQELRKAFEAQRAQYARPARARVALLLLAAPPADARARSRQRAEAQALLADARRALSRDPGAFATLARRRSEDPATRALGGELPPATEQQLLERYGPELAAAVFGGGPGSAAGGLLPVVIETPRGFYLVHVREREPAVEPRFEDLRELLRPRVTRERREQRLEAFADRLVQQARVELHPEALGASASR